MGKATIKQFAVRQAFKKCCDCFGFQPLTNGASPDEFGYRARQYWYTSAESSGLWYYDYFMKQSMPWYLTIEDTGPPPWCVNPEWHFLGGYTGYTLEKKGNGVSAASVEAANQLAWNEYTAADYLTSAVNYMSLASQGLVRKPHAWSDWESDRNQMSAVVKYDTAFFASDDIHLYTAALNCQSIEVTNDYPSPASLEVYSGEFDDLITSFEFTTWENTAIEIEATYINTNTDTILSARIVPDSLYLLPTSVLDNKARFRIVCLNLFY